MLPYMPPPEGLSVDAHAAHLLRQEIAREIEEIHDRAAWGKGPPPYRTTVMIPEWPPHGASPCARLAYEEERRERLADMFGALPFMPFDEAEIA